MKSQRIYANPLCVTTFVATLGLGIGGCAQQEDVDSLPEGYSLYITHIANGEVDPTEPHPEVSGCLNFICDGDYFQKVIMGRDDATVALLEAQAKNKTYVSNLRRC